MRRDRESGIDRLGALLREAAESAPLEQVDWQALHQRIVEAAERVFDARLNGSKGQPS